LLEVLMPIRSAMNARRRRKAAEGLVAMERCWRLPGDRARFGFGRPVRPSPLLGSLRAMPPSSRTQTLMTKGTQGHMVLP
jgi:hypothetical protein